MSTIKNLGRGASRNYLTVEPADVELPEGHLVFDLTSYFESEILSASKSLSSATLCFTSVTLEDFYPADIMLPETARGDICKYLKTGEVEGELKVNIKRLASAIAETIDLKLQDGNHITFSHADTIEHAGKKGKVGYLFLVLNSADRTTILQAETSFVVGVV